MKDTYTVEIWGENNSFTVEAQIDFEPFENWIDGRMYYQPFLVSVKLVHGDRRREVVDIISEEQADYIIKEIFRINQEEFEHADFSNDYDNEDNYYSTEQEYREYAGVC